MKKTEGSMLGEEIVEFCSGLDKPEAFFSCLTTGLGLRSRLPDLASKTQTPSLNLNFRGKKKTFNMS